MKGIKQRNPDQTRNGRVKLAPLNASKLEQMLSMTASKKQKGKIRQELDRKLSRIS